MIANQLESRTPTWWQNPAWLLLALYVLVYIFPLGVRPMVSPDEVRYGEISREMIASGDWVSPHFNGVRYFEKPILGYWLNSASFVAFGENAFALRLPTSLAAGLTALIIFFLTLNFATRFSAYLATGIYLSTVLVLGVGTFAVLDTFLSLFLTGAMASYYFAYRAVQPARRQWLLGICGAFCAGAFLTKGFLALVIPTIVIGAYLLARRDWQSMLKTPWIPIIVAGVLVAPWAILVHLREPDYWHYFFWIEHVQRFLGDSAQHKEPFWYFLVNGPFAALPWIAMLPAAVVGMWRGRGEHSPLAGYAVAWVLLPFLFFSASNGKLLTYILPCCAPAAIFLAIGLERYFSTSRRAAFAIGSGCLAMLFAAILVLAALAQRGMFAQELFAADENLRYLGFMGCIAGALFASIFALAARSRGLRLGAITVSGVALFLPLHFAFLPRAHIDGKIPADYLAEELQVGPDTILISDAPYFGSVAWSFKRDDVYVLSEGEISYGLAYPESRHRSLDGPGFTRLIDENRASHDIAVVVRATMESELPSAALARAQRKQRGEVVMFLIPSG
jgi:4-amino-4-deoxy-L-arabinose transferase